MDQWTEVGSIAIPIAFGVAPQKYCVYRPWTTLADENRARLINKNGILIAVDLTEAPEDVRDAANALQVALTAWDARLKDSQ
jgi:hypothetical protein